MELIERHYSGRFHQVTMPYSYISLLRSLKIIIWLRNTFLFPFLLLIFHISFAYNFHLHGCSMQHIDFSQLHSFGAEKSEYVSGASICCENHDRVDANEISERKVSEFLLPLPLLHWKLSFALNMSMRNEFKAWNSLGRDKKWKDVFAKCECETAISMVRRSTVS